MRVNLRCLCYRQPNSLRGTHKNDFMDGLTLREQKSIFTLTLSFAGATVDAAPTASLEQSPNMEGVFLRSTALPGAAPKGLGPKRDCQVRQAGSDTYLIQERFPWIQNERRVDSVGPLPSFVQPVLKRSLSHPAINRHVPEISSAVEVEERLVFNPPAETLPTGSEVPASSGSSDGWSCRWFLTPFQMSR